MARKTQIPEEPQPRYEALRQAVEDLMESEEYGSPVGATVGWVLVAVEQDVSNQREALTIVPAPWQSYHMSYGILQGATDDLFAAYIASGWNGPGEEDEDE